MRDGDLVEFVGIAVGKGHFEPSSQRMHVVCDDLDIFNRLAEPELDALCDEAFLETLRCLGKRVHVEHVRVDAYERHIEIALEAGFERLERYHGSAAYEHARAARVSDGVSQTFGIFHGSEHDGLIAAIFGKSNRCRH